MISQNVVCTIGVPVKDASSQIPSLIHDIKRQTYINIEVIISDNASEDSTVAKILELTATDPRFNLSTERSEIGMLENFQKVLDLASGDFFCWFPADDRHSPEFIEHCVGFLNQHPYHVACVPDGECGLRSMPNAVNVAAIEADGKSERTAELFSEHGDNLRLLSVFRSSAVKNCCISQYGFVGGDWCFVHDVLQFGKFGHIGSRARIVKSNTGLSEDMVKHAEAFAVSVRDFFIPTYRLAKFIVGTRIDWVKKARAVWVFCFLWQVRYCRKLAKDPSVVFHWNTQRKNRE